VVLPLAAQRYEQSSVVVDACTDFSGAVESGRHLRVAKAPRRHEAYTERVLQGDFTMMARQAIDSFGGPSDLGQLEIAVLDLIARGIESLAAQRPQRGGETDLFVQGVTALGALAYADDGDFALIFLAGEVETSFGRTYGR
jgi:hypothetical protein